MLFERSARRRVSLHISAVNLAEAIEHARDYTRETGTDVVSLLESFGIAIHSPGVEAARKAAALAFLRSLSMADRFAAGTAELLGARLYTTDSALAAALRKRRVAPPVTLF